LIDVVIVEDDEIIRSGLECMLEEAEDMRCVASFGDCESALRDLADKRVDVLLMDIGLPGMSGIEGVKAIRKILGDLDIIMVTIHSDDTRIFDALRAGARGYLTKNVAPERLINAIREVHAGGAPMNARIARLVVDSMRRSGGSTLTKREREVLGSLCEGNSYKMIADRLFISDKTVHTHIKNIYRKLEVHSQTEAVSKAFRDGLV